MKIVTKHIRIKNEDLVLTNQRAIYWRRESALVLADVHIGKTAHFRKHGIPMPDAILQNDLDRLKALILHFEVKQLLIVGDLFHAENNSEMATFKLWLQQFRDLKITLIKGNHDRLSSKIMVDFSINATTELFIEPFTFIHEHLESHTNEFTISGHIHPGYLIKGKGKQKLKLPCYQVNSNQIVLPAFSLFTGLNTKLGLDKSDIYAFTDENIYVF